ncbi:ABC transporter ATP-binding protein [Tepidibacter thalassicus]|uniref:Iron complex transport system ATP-binding protein n=1 Tax=Tepidibacter thalassicus DSM 15285 TaxID=1123350 RepID=A0A1M5SPN3_9FIRM|nr:ABC transporter ATP-binding protein [Tepidibacter thalassicus]SHH40298.1 iron complex transport system ATP-binding protein [Tepidibacter thalassicus DSM 15285]
MLKVQNVSFSYKDKVVLDDISFSMGKGKFLSIIGPNGSGKTTLLNLLTGYLEKKTGSIKFLGKEIKNYSVEELSRNFAIINQNTNIRFPFTCLEIVMMGRNPFRERMKKLSENDMEIVYKSMEITDTLKFSDSLITQISGGEFQRVMLARALSQKPSILFLDEAFSAMDISQRIKSLKLIKGLVIKEGLTVVSIIHDLNLAYMFSDEVCVLKEGKMVAFGKCSDIMTADFINEVFDINVDRIDNRGFLIML